MFDLLRYFSISSALLIAVLSIGVGTGVSRYETSRLVAAAGEQNETIAAQMVAIAWDPHADFLSTTPERDPTQLKQSWQITDIDLSVRQAALRLPIYKMKIFKPNGLTLYSSDLSEVGVVADINKPEFASALAGRPHSTLNQVPSAIGMGGRLKNIESVETYLPKHDANGQIVGVVEIYTDVTAASARMHEMIRSTILLSIGICLFLYASLYVIASRADRLMRSQYRALQGFNERLDTEVSQRTAHMLNQQLKLGELMRSARFQTGTQAEALAALNEGGAAILDVDRCGIYLPRQDATHFDVIDTYDRRTKRHTGWFSRPAEFFLSNFKSMAEGDVICVSDIETAKHIKRSFLECYRSLSIRSAMDVPIFIDGRQTGILCFRKSGGPHEWRADERLAASALATLAALIMQRTEREKVEASIIASTQHLARQQIALTDMAREVARPSHDLEHILRPMLRSFAEINNCQSAGIWILAEDRQSFSYAETYSTMTGEVESAHGRTSFNLAALELHDGIAAPVTVSDVRENAFCAPFYADVLAKVGIVSLLRAPILVEGALIGFVSCAGERPRQWTAEQSLFATGIANIAALAVERHQRRRAESQIVATAEALSRQQNVLNALLHAESFRNGSLSAAMRKLSRTFAKEAGIDRVSITVRAIETDKIEYSETYLANEDFHQSPFIGLDFHPHRMLASARAGVAIIADDVETHPDTQQYLDVLLRHVDVRSFMQIPIEVGGGVVGVINASVCGRSIVWSTNQKLFATAIGNLAALTIERSQRQRFERAIAGVAARLEMQQAAITGFMNDEHWRRGDLTDAVQMLSKMASETLGIERVSIWKMSVTRDAVVALEIYDQRTDKHAQGAILSQADHPTCFAALFADGLVTCDDVISDTRFDTLSGHFQSRDVRSVLGMPILMEGTTVGVVCAEKCGEPVTWSEEHRLFLSAVTSLVALVIERLDRKRAEDEISAGAGRLAHMLESFGSLMKSDVVRHGSLSETLRALSQTLCEEIGADRAAILLVQSSSNDVVSAEAYVRASGQHEAPLYPPGRSWPEIRAQIDISSSLSIEDVAAHEDFMAGEAALVGSQNLGSLLQLPIVIDGNVTGAIRATTLGRKIKWAPEARLFAAAIAQLASLAVERNTRQRVERDLRHANMAAEEANRAKSQFLANMSHEIRTPMNGVFGMTEILIKSPLSDRQRRQVGTIHESAKNLLTIVNDVLDLSRIEDGKMPIDAQPFDLHQCIESAAELFAEDAQRKGLDLRVFIAAGTPTHIIGDVGRLRQVCVNVISNAIKFTPRGEVEIRLSASSVLGGQAKDGQANISINIRDTGIGINTGTAGRLFEPFTQADSSISRRFGGTGLGLSISRHLMSLMGGSISLDSRPHQGTHVAISMPCKIAVVPSLRIINVEALRGQRILVVDDRDTNREILVDYLSEAGAMPVNARRGEMALEILTAAADAGHPFAAVIVDMLMPDMDGMTLCRAIRDTSNLASIGLVMVTSMTWDGDLQAANEIGITRLLTKPVRRADLLEAVSRAVVDPRPATATAPRPIGAETPKLHAHVLIAEDNPINEEVVRELLLGMNCTVRVATNGRAACRAFEAEPFDLVLMDCQMPEMDGLTATHRLRKLEQSLGRPRTPVIAVTAHAFEADRIACRNAGMDDYLMKPFTETELAQVLIRWITPFKTAATSKGLPILGVPDEEAQFHAAVAIDSSQTGLDEALLADLRKRRPQLFERLLTAYLAHSPKNVSQLFDALAQKQINALYLAAHSLKSSSANVGAKRVAELARDIEALARKGTCEDIAPIADDLRAAFERTGHAMRASLQRAKAGS